MKPKVIRYRGGYKYQLAETYVIKTCITGFSVVTEFILLEPDGTLTIVGGYAWDGPSGPAIDTPSFMRGSLVHDALYQLMRLGLLPPECRLPADQELRRICLEDGMWRVRAWWVYRGVRRAAAGAASPKHKKPILEAP